MTRWPVDEATIACKDDHGTPASAVGLNQANTADRVPDAPLDRLDLQVCICRWIDIRIRCIALAPL
jgi:hypothetical protein